MSSCPARRGICFYAPRFIASKRGFLLFCFALSALFIYLMLLYFRCRSWRCCRYLRNFLRGTLGTFGTFSCLQSCLICVPFAFHSASIYVVILDFSPYQTLVKTLSSPSLQHLIPSSIHQKNVVSLCRYVAIPFLFLFLDHFGQFWTNSIHQLHLRA